VYDEFYDKAGIQQLRAQGVEALWTGSHEGELELSS